MFLKIRKQDHNFIFLEEVRKNLHQLPSIDPQIRTLLLCGFPNVGKSSFINIFTTATVSVQPYPFTTTSLFVGHMEYNNRKWQILDTPGILDRPMDDRKAIEVQSVAAITHLRSTILFVIDISEQCGYSLVEQLGLLESTKALFKNKPIMVVANKTDLLSVEQLEENKKIINSVLGEFDFPSLFTSVFKTEGINEVKETACELLENVLQKSRPNFVPPAAISNPSSQPLVDNVTLTEEENQMLLEMLNL